MKTVLSIKVTEKTKEEFKKFYNYLKTINDNITQEDIIKIMLEDPVIRQIIERKIALRK